MSNHLNARTPQYSVVVVHGICANTGSQQTGFSRKLAKRVLKDDKFLASFHLLPLYLHLLREALIVAFNTPDY